MSESRISNWCLALSDHLPTELQELRAEVEALDRLKMDKLALIADYTELLSIARRRVPAEPLTLARPETRYLAGSECAA